MTQFADKPLTNAETAVKPYPTGQTTGTAGRAAQSLTGTMLTFDLPAEAAQLRTEHGYREGDRNAKTLLKAPDSRIVLTTLRAGARLPEHHAAGRVAIQTISGRLRLQVLDQTVDLPAGPSARLGTGYRPRRGGAGRECRPTHAGLAAWQR